MEAIFVNRFKAYRELRWKRSDYLWSSRNPYLVKHKIIVTTDAAAPCDVLAVPCPHLPGQESRVHRDDELPVNTTIRGVLDYQDTPIICDSSLDYAFLDPEVQRVLSYPQVKFYLSGVSFRDMRAQQRLSWCGEYYGHVYKQRELYQSGPQIYPERPPLSDEVTNKIWPINRPVTEPFDDAVFAYIKSKSQPLNKRPIDLFFAGRTRYCPNPARCFCTAARQHLADIWPKLPGTKVFVDYHNFLRTKKDGKTVTSYAYPYEYVDQLLASKVVISPWGRSPWCIRDLEALACGCIVIKPECSNLLIYPDIYDPKQQLMVWCDIQYEHLGGQLSYIYQNLDEFQPRATRGQKFVTDAVYPRDKVYSRWTADLRKVLERCL